MFTGNGSNLYHLCDRSHSAYGLVSSGISGPWLKFLCTPRWWRRFSTTRFCWSRLWKTSDFRTRPKRSRSNFSGSGSTTWTVSWGRSHTVYFPTGRQQTSAVWRVIAVAIVTVIIGWLWRHRCCDCVGHDQLIVTSSLLRLCRSETVDCDADQLFILKRSRKSKIQDF